MSKRRALVSSLSLSFLLAAQAARAGVANGDWKTGDFTDWSVSKSTNPAQQSGVGGFAFAPPAEGPGNIAPCAAQGGVGNCAAYFAAGGPQASAVGGSIFLSQNGAPPPLGTGQLFLNAGAPTNFAADIAAQNRLPVPTTDSGIIIVRLRPSSQITQGTGTIVAQQAFGPLSPFQIVTTQMSGMFIPAMTGPHILEVEFHRNGPHVPNSTPLNWIDNISLEEGPCPCNADTTGDANVDVQDLVRVQQCIGQPSQGPCTHADVDCDGFIDPDDAQAVICQLEGGFPEDCCGPQLSGCCLADGCSPLLPVKVCTANGGVPVQDCSSCVPAGPDCWETSCGRTLFDFCTNPIPADFFSPGSLPFEGVIRLGGGAGGADTVVERRSMMVFDPQLPSTAQVPIELVALNLVSCQPIVVQPGGSEWNVHVAQSTAGPLPPTGMLMATKQHFNGGMFSAQFLVQPRFTFTRVDDPMQVRVLDFGQQNLPPIPFNTDPPAPWVHVLSDSILHKPCGVNFVPGVEENTETLEQCCAETCHAGPGPGHQHCTLQCSVCPRGACCNTIGGCSIAEDPELCLGQYMGDGTNCDDADGDGIANVFETNDCCLPDLGPCNTGTNPHSADTDGDGIDDAAELAMGCDPCAAVPCGGVIDDLQTVADTPATPTRLTIGGPDIPVIPADFFGPGSEPFVGVVRLRGLPIDPVNLGETSTRVRRFGDPVSPLDPPGATGMVPIELVQLSLTSIMPITVNYTGGPSQQWNVEVELSQNPQPPGTMMAAKTHANGGTFNSTLRVLAKFVFTRIDVPSTRILDMGVEGLPPIQLMSVATPFVHHVDPNLDILVEPGASFVPGVVETIPGNTGSQTVATFTENAPSVTHTVRPPPGKRCIYRLDCIDGHCEGCLLHNPGRLCQKSYCTPTGGTCADLLPTTCGGPDCCIDLNLVDCRFPDGEPECPDFEQSCPCDPQPGACCRDDGTCSILTESRCTVNGGMYKGDGTVCGPTGACCFPDGSCEEMAETCCDSLGGFFEGGTCDAVQRCCLPDGSCDNLDPECCQLVGGLPEEGLCEPNQACCLGGGVCRNLDPRCCELAGGMPEGAGTACTEPQGCCLLLGECLDADPLCCEDMFGTPQGAGTACTAPGGCCFGNGECQNLDPLCCEDLDGVFTGGTCDPPRECCLSDGSCINTDPQCCIFVFDGTPGVGACETPRRCCMPDGSCMDLDPDCCDNLGGLPGTGTCEPPRKCCRENGDCVDTDSYCCVHRFDGIPGIGAGLCGPLLECCLPDTGECRDVDNTCCALSLGGDAGNFACTGITQECCLDGGECRELEGNCCISIGGNPGFGNCDPIQACCFLADRSCSDLEPDCCTQEGGIPQGLSACTVADACCLPTGQCVMIDPICCDDLGGVWEGFGSTCTVPQACCLPNGTCVIADPLCCEDQGGVPEGPGTICTAPQACCLPNGTCQLLDRLCCVDRGGAPQGPGSACTATRACCFDAGACQDLDPLCCVEEGGTPLAAGTTCNDADDEGGNPCQPPTQACCRPDGSCMDLPSADCTAGGGTPQGAGTTCSDAGMCHKPFIVHAAGLAGQTRPCSGYIDPRAESNNGVTLNQGLDSVTLVFNEPVFAPGGGAVGPANFVMTETGAAVPPGVTLVDASANPLIVVRLSRFITLREWTTVRAVVRNAAGVLIDNQGNLGPGMNEPDRLDVAFLVADVNNSGNVNPLDLLKFKRLVNGLDPPGCGLLTDYADLNRVGGVNPLDLLRLKQAINNITPPSTQSWSGQALLHTRP